MYIPSPLPSMTRPSAPSTLQTREKKEPSSSRRSITLPGKRLVSLCVAATPYREKRPEACLPLACVGFLYENVFPLVERDANRMARMARGLLARLSFLLILQLPALLRALMLVGGAGPDQHSGRPATLVKEQHAPNSCFGRLRLGNGVDVLGADRDLIEQGEYERACPF